jgi:tRNA(Met) cytidine acetyltransferase
LGGDLANATLLGEVREEVRGGDIDWLGTAFGATPELLSFWQRNGYGAVHLGTARNETSGERSVVMLSPLSDSGRALHDRHARWFCDRLRALLSDALADADPDVVRAALHAVDAEVAPDLTPRSWRVVADAAYGPGLFTADPGAFRRLAVAHLADPADPDLLTPRQERLLVLKVLQGRPWSAPIDALGFHSHREVMRALGEAFRPLVDAYGDGTARRQRDRYG